MPKNWQRLVVRVKKFSCFRIVRVFSKIASCLALICETFGFFSVFYESFGEGFYSKCIVFVAFSLF